MHHDADQWQSREDSVALRHEAREQAEARAEFEYRRTSGETPAEREYRLYYAAQNSPMCECGETLGMHDWPDGRCMAPGSSCLKFSPAKQYDRLRLTPGGEVLPARSEAA